MCVFGAFWCVSKRFCCIPVQFCAEKMQHVLLFLCIWNAVELQALV
ncbi:unnamed protein product [Staurois parvus]|uniref:Uncharacterized protein n=1 Tax=Staurois parvus TaxID=386267 RepID=A0ABN9HQ77_9NEOB|nr:unnamed protein product [Staurois parvus]